MRLVDADKLRDKCDEYDWDTIDNEPTVEAIPISIIKEELDDAHKRHNNSTELTESFWRGYVSALEVLIIRWEKENEQNKENTSSTD